MIDFKIARKRSGLSSVSYSRSANGYSNDSGWRAVPVFQLDRHAYHQDSLSEKLFEGAAQRFYDEDPVAQKGLVGYRFHGVELLDTEKVDADSSDLLRNEIVCGVFSQVSVVVVDGIISPTFAASCVADYELIYQKFPVTHREK